MSETRHLLAAFRAYLARQDGPPVSDFIAGFDWEMAQRPLTPVRLPVVDALPASSTRAATAEAGVLSALVQAADALRFAQTYSAGDFGEEFLLRYGFVEVFGTRGHFENEAMAGGFLLLGPDVHYPDHHHTAEEIYIPLTSGSYWSKAGGPFEQRRTGEVIHHPSGVPHAMRTTAGALVALYLWRGGPLAQKSIISGSKT
jgi:hypothetical protein